MGQGPSIEKIIEAGNPFTNPNTNQSIQRISDNIQQIADTGFKETGHTLRTFSNDTRDVITTGEVELGKTSRQLLLSTENVLTTGEIELGKTSRQFLLSTENVITTGEIETGKTIRAISSNVTQNVDSIVENTAEVANNFVITQRLVFISAIAGATLVAISVSNNTAKTIPKVTKDLADTVPEITKTLAKAEETTIKHVAETLQKQPQLAKNVENIVSKVTDAIPTKTVSNLTKNLAETTQSIL